MKGPSYNIASTAIVKASVYTFVTFSHGMSNLHYYTVDELSLPYHGVGFQGSVLHFFFWVKKPAIFISAFTFIQNDLK